MGDRQSGFGGTVSLWFGAASGRQGPVDFTGSTKICAAPSSDRAGLKKAHQAILPSVPWQRSQFHLQQNARGYVPKVAMRAEVAQAIRDISWEPCTIVRKLIDDQIPFPLKQVWTDERGRGNFVAESFHPE